MRDDINALEDKARKLIAESARLRQREDALVKKIAQLSGKPKEETSKPKPSKAIVQCAGYRCTGHKKADGSWIDQRGQALKVLEVVSWLD